MIRNPPAAWTRNPLVIDVAIAVLVAVVVLIITPGVAVAALLAVLVIVACAVSFLISSRRRSWAPGGSRAPRGACDACAACAA